MGADGRRDERPRGAVLGPLVLLLAAAVTGYGMWHALMQNSLETTAPVTAARLVQGPSH